MRISEIVKLRGLPARMKKVRKSGVNSLYEFPENSVVTVTSFLGEDRWESPQVTRMFPHEEDSALIDSDAWVPVEDRDAHVLDTWADLAVRFGQLDPAEVEEFITSKEEVSV